MQSSAVLIGDTVVLLVWEFNYQQCQHHHYVHRHHSVVQMPPYHCFMLLLPFFVLFFVRKELNLPEKDFFGKWFDVYFVAIIKHL